MTEKKVTPDTVTYNAAISRATKIWATRVLSNCIQFLLLLHIASRNDVEMLWTLETRLAISIWVQTTHLNPTRIKIREYAWVYMGLSKCFNWGACGSHWRHTLVLLQHCQGTSDICTFRSSETTALAGFFFWFKHCVQRFELFVHSYISFTTYLYLYLSLLFGGREDPTLFACWTYPKDVMLICCKVWNLMS